MLHEIREKWREGRLGFKMDEVMTGAHWFEPGCGPEGSHPFEFRVTWGTANVAAWMDPASRGFHNELKGTVTAAGLCDAAPCQGTLDLRYFDEHKIRYAFRFEAGGKRYDFVGEKMNIRPWNLPYSHTTCFGTIKEADTGKLVSRTLAHFKILDAPAFVRSLRWA
jgi:hypothetical protein